jgi:hypothetical protein
MVGTDIYPTDHVVGLHATETPLTTDWGRVALVFSVTTDGTIDLILALGVNGTCQGTLWTDGVSCVDITESDRLFKALDDNAALRGVTNLPSSQVQFQIVDENGNLFNPLGATTVGAAAQIISKPFWLKAGGTTVPYLSADCDIPSLSQNTPYWVYFDDPGFVGGDVSLYATTNLGEAQANIGRICLGVIKTPKSLTGARTERPTVYDDFGTASVYNPTGAFDATENVADTYCEVKGFTVPLPPLFEEYEQTEAHCIFRGFTNPAGSKSSVELSITSLVDTANGYGVLSYSLDGGVTWEDVYTAYDSLALVTDSISLSDDQDWSQVQVYAVGCTTMAMLGAYGSVSVYDINITGTIG